MAEHEIHIGTAGWNYPSGEGKWSGVFYPSGRVDELEFYSRYFDCVEINSTFYRPHTPAMASAWARRTPPEFRFVVKLWQKFTHPRMFEAHAGQAEIPTATDADLFRRGLDPLVRAGKLGALLIQFPPSCHNGAENRDRLQWTLGQFRDYPLVVEFRHRSWSDQSAATDRFLSAHKATWVQIDEPKFDSSVAQDFRPHGPLFYLRFHGRNKEQWWGKADNEKRYDYLYADEELKPFADKIRATAGRTVYAIFNNHYGGKALANAFQFRALLGRKTARPPEALASRFPFLRALSSAGA